MVVDPSKAPARWALPILKVMPGQRFSVVLAGSKWWFFGSHWLDRQYLCTGSGCEGCVYGVPRVMGYRVGVLLGGQRPRTVLVEAPLTSVGRLESLAQMEGFECGRGATIELSRKHRRAGVALEATAPEVSPLEKPLTDQHTIGALAVLFGLPAIEEREEPPAWAARVESIAHARLVAALAKAR